MSATTRQGRVVGQSCLWDVRHLRRLLVGALALAQASCDGSDSFTDPGDRPGRIDVAVSTVGAAPDPDGYTVSLDGGDPRSVADNATLTFSAVAVGHHTVALTGIAANCAVAATNPRPVDVEGGAAVSVAFDVVCDATGALEMTTSTTGLDLDPEYQLVVDGEAASIGANARVSRTGVLAGPHDVELRGIADNCALTGDSIRSVEVPAGGLGRTRFEVSCTGPTGTLRLTVRTVGANPDPNGYTLVLDGMPGPSVSPNALLELPGLASGDHDVSLTGVADNCRLGGFGNGIVVTVQPGAVTAATLRVECFGATLETLVVGVTTVNPPAGLVLVFIGIDGREVGFIAGSNGTASFQVPSGHHTVSVSRPAPGCGALPGLQQSVDIHAGHTVRIGFLFIC